MKKHYSILLKDILPSALNELGLSKKLNEQRVMEAWKEAFGLSLSNYTTNIYFKNKTLYVAISSSLLKNDLLLQKELLIEKLNQLTSEKTVQNIIFL